MAFTITKDITDFLVTKHGMDRTLSYDQQRSFLAGKVASGELEIKELTEIANKDGKETAERLKGWVRDAIAESIGGTKHSPADSHKAADVFGAGRINVKGPSGQYDDTRLVAKHIKTGAPVMDEHGAAVCHPTQRLQAKAGALFKFLCKRGGMSVKWGEHDKALMDEMFANDRWIGEVQGEYKGNIDGMQIKALLDDSTSGGTYAVPTWFDDLVVVTPLLYGELYPFVDVVPLPYGSDTEGAKIGNPSVTWGTSEGTAIAPIDTDSLVSQYTATIHPVSVAVEVGRDLQADSPSDVGSKIMEVLGQAMLNSLDDVIANGNGTSEPEGIFTASGITANAWGGDAATVGDYEGLVFGVAKQYRQANWNPCFIANDTSYSRARGIAVGDADQRRVFGMNHQSYTLLEYPYRVQNDIANTTIAFGCLKKYRLYRRGGSEVRTIREDWELARKNTEGIIVRQRIGGLVVDASAFCKTTTALA